MNQRSGFGIPMWYLWCWTIYNLFSQLYIRVEKFVERPENYFLSSPPIWLTQKSKSAKDRSLVCVLSGSGQKLVVICDLRAQNFELNFIWFLHKDHTSPSVILVRVWLTLIDSWQILQELLGSLLLCGYRTITVYYCKSLRSSLWAC